MQSRVLKEGWLDINTGCQPGRDKWNKANYKSRYCVLQRRDGRLSLEVYDNDLKTGTSHTLQLNTALNAAKRYRCQVVTEDGTVLCVMEGKDERVISGWVVSLNSGITTASTDKDITQHTDSETDTQRETDTDSATAEGEDAGTAPHRSRQLSEEPEVIKKGWLNIHTDPAPGEDKCSRYEVVTMDGGAMFVMDGTDDVMTDWVVSLNRAIMAARCQGNSESHDDVIGVDRDDSDDGALEKGLRALSLAEAETEFLHAWFPDLDTQIYIIPRVHFSTVHVYDDYTVGGHKVQFLKTEEEIKRQDNEQNIEARVVMSIDDILKRVHYTMNTIIKEIAHSETMVIMTEVRCGLYASLYAGAADMNNNTHSAEISQASRVTKWDMKRDLADLLVIHRDRGLLLGAVIRKTGSDVRALCDDIKNALDYLDQAEAVVNDVILPRVAGGSIVAVNKTILLPNLERANLQSTIHSLKPESR